MVVLEQDNGRFTNFIPVEFVQDRCDSVDQMSVGDEVEVAYRLNGRKWQRDPSSEVKFFLSAEAMHFKVLKSKGGAAAEDQIASANDAFLEAADDDDVPF